MYYGDSNWYLKKKKVNVCLFLFIIFKDIFSELFGKYLSLISY